MIWVLLRALFGDLGISLKGDFDLGCLRRLVIWDLLRKASGGLGFCQDRIFRRFGHFSGENFVTLGNRRFRFIAETTFW